MADRPTNGSIRNLYWILGSVFTVSLLLVSIIISGFGSTVSSIAADTKVNTRLTTKHESDIGYVKETLLKIDGKLDRLLQSKK